MVCLIIIFNILFNLLRELCVTETVRHGESDKPQATYPIAAYADDIAYMIKQLGLDKAVAVGHSMWGLAVLQLAALHPDRVVAIVMIDPAWLRTEQETKSGKLGADETMRPRSAGLEVGALTSPCT